MPYSEGEWRRSKTGWVVKTETDRICGVKHNKGQDDIAEANARLIKAAPKLHKACKYALEVLESMPDKMRGELEDILDEDIDLDLLNTALQEVNGV